MYKEVVLGGDTWDLLDELMIYMGNPMQYYEKKVKFVRVNLSIWFPIRKVSRNIPLVKKIFHPQSFVFCRVCFSMDLLEQEKHSLLALLQSRAGCLLFLHLVQSLLTVREVALHELMRSFLLQGEM